MWKISVKNKIANNTNKHVAAEGTDSNKKFKWLDDLFEDLLKALINFKTVMEFQNKDFNTDNMFTYTATISKNLACARLILNQLTFKTC